MRSTAACEKRQYQKKSGKSHHRNCYISKLHYKGCRASARISNRRACHRHRGQSDLQKIMVAGYQGAYNRQNNALVIIIFFCKKRNSQNYNFWVHKYPLEPAKFAWLVSGYFRIKQAAQCCGKTDCERKNNRVSAEKSDNFFIADHQRNKNNRNNYLAGNRKR